MKRKPQLIVILGPTASGKSALAVELARKIDGEVVSADSRQVYRGLNLGSGKVTKREMKGVPHHLLDVADPRRRFTVAEFKRLAEKAIDGIIARDKTPIICGGTGFYIQSVVHGIVPPEVPPNPKLRNSLAMKSASVLHKMLTRLDPARAKSIDKQNKVRMIRAIEIAKELGKVPKIKRKPKYKCIQFGIKVEPDELREKIEKRLRARFKKGMLIEANRLHKSGLSWKRMEELGLEYRFMARHLQRKITRSEMIQTLDTEIWHYARRQMAWFRRDKRIRWATAQELAKELARFS